MNIATFTKLIEDAGGAVLAVETVNTNNGWGFGGWAGKRARAQVGEHAYFFDKGSASTRHAGTFPIERVWVDEPKVGTAFAPKAFAEAFRAGVRTYDKFVAELA